MLAMCEGPEYVNSLSQTMDAACQILGHHTIFHSFHADFF